MRYSIRIVASLILALFIFSAFKSDKPAYRLVTGESKKTEFSKMLKEAIEADVVFFGELHNNPISHWLRLELAEALLKEKEGRLILAAEMFEKDNQLLLDEYTSGTITERSFESQAKLWPNYKTDYKPLTQIARKHKLKFIASNIPRRYAAMVNSGGFEALANLDPEAHKLIAPLPVPYDPELGCYKKMMEMQGGGAMGQSSPTFPMAQAIKDATMAHALHADAGKGTTILHFNGAFHTDFKEGIVWYLEKYKPGLKILTITTVEQEALDTLDADNKGIADYVIMVPANMTKTH